MAVSSGVPTALVSPMARPGSRSPPSPGSAPAASRNRARRPFAQSRYQGAVDSTRIFRSANSRNATSSEGSVADRVPASVTVAPTPIVAAGRCANTMTGVLTVRVRAPRATRASVAENTTWLALSFRASGAVGASAAVWVAGADGVSGAVWIAFTVWVACTVWVTVAVAVTKRPACAASTSTSG